MNTAKCLDKTFGAWVKEIDTNVVEILRKDAIQTNKAGDTFLILDVETVGAVTVAYLGLIVNGAVESVHVQIGNWGIISAESYLEALAKLEAK